MQSLNCLQILPYYITLTLRQYSFCRLMHTILWRVDFKQFVKACSLCTLCMFRTSYHSSHNYVNKSNNNKSIIQSKWWSEPHRKGDILNLYVEFILSRWIFLNVICTAWLLNKWVMRSFDIFLNNMQIEILFLLFFQISNLYPPSWWLNNNRK